MAHPRAPLPHEIQGRVGGCAACRTPNANGGGAPAGASGRKHEWAQERMVREAVVMDAPRTARRSTRPRGQAHDSRRADGDAASTASGPGDAASTAPRGRKTAAATTAATSSAAGAEAGNGDGDTATAAQRRLFLAALERKRGREGAGGRPHDPGHTVIPSSNTKRQRTFRRRAGG